MITTKEDFRNKFLEISDSMFGRDPGRLDDRDRSAVLGRLIETEARERVAEKKEKNRDRKKVYYFSMEFLIGKLMENYLINLGIRDFAEDVLK